MDLNNLTGWIKNRLQKMILNFVESRSDLATKSKKTKYIFLHVYDKFSISLYQSN